MKQKTFGMGLNRHIGQKLATSTMCLELAIIAFHVSRTAPLQLRAVLQGKKKTRKSLEKFINNL